MGRVKSAKDLPEGVLEFESTPEGDVIFGEDLKKAKKQQSTEKAKEELAKTDTLANKAKAVGEDAFKTVFGFKSPDYGSRPFNKATKEHNEKVKSLKKEAEMKKGGRVKKMATGGKVAGKLATRGYGCVKK